MCGACDWDKWVERIDRILGSDRYVDHAFEMSILRDSIRRREHVTDEDERAVVAVEWETSRS